MDQELGECPLTPRELDVLRRAALTNAEIAWSLGGLSRSTVRNHFHSAAVKLLGHWDWRRGHSSRALLLVLALRAGWISLDEVVLDVDPAMDARIRRLVRAKRVVARLADQVAMGVTKGGGWGNGWAADS